MLQSMRETSHRKLCSSLERLREKRDNPPAPAPPAAAQVKIGLEHAPSNKVGNKTTVSSADMETDGAFQAPIAQIPSIVTEAVTLAAKETATSPGIGWSRTLGARRPCTALCSW